MIHGPKKLWLLIFCPLHLTLFLPLCRGSGAEQTSHDTGLTSQKAVSVFQEALAQVLASLILSARLGLRFHRLLYLSEREASQWSRVPRRRHDMT